MRPGHWRSGGRDIPYSEMDDRYFKNAMRYQRTQVTKLNTMTREYDNSTEKMAELGEEAQRRGLIPSRDLTMLELMGYVAVWQNQYEERQSRNNRMQVAALVPTAQYNERMAPLPPPTPLFSRPYISPVSLDAIRLLERRTELSVEIPLLQEISVLAGLVEGAESRAVALEDERQLDSDL